MKSIISAMYNVCWYNLHAPEIKARGYWDQAMLEELFKDYHHTESLEELDGAVVIIPARHHANDIDKINTDLSKLSWVLLILTGDEEQVFPTNQLSHPNMIIWSMTPHVGKYKNIDRFLVNGYAPHLSLTKEHKSKEKKTLDWFFAGQVTHGKREECVNALENQPRGELIKTAGFTQGLDPKEYVKKLVSAKVAPCPSGPVIPDTFRLYEALEAGCVPIVDDGDYFNYILGTNPIPALEWHKAADYINNFAERYPEMNNQIFAWWQRYKRTMQYWLEDDLMKLTGNLNIPAVTVLIPTSPIASHPATAIITATVKSVQEQLPGCEILLMIDGVRAEQAHYKDSYDEYIRRLLWKANNEWENVYPLLFEEHQHQANMTKEALKHVRTPYVVFVEHDTPLDGYIPWGAICEIIKAGDANVVRFFHEAVWQEPHEHMMLGPVQELNGVRLRPTCQWSQRPHIATADFYRYLLDKYVPHGKKAMIEDEVHGPVANSYLARDKVGWNEFKVWIYAPEGDMKRSLNLDGRGNDPKWVDS